MTQFSKSDANAEEPESVVRHLYTEFDTYFRNLGPKYGFQVLDLT